MKGNALLVIIACFLGIIAVVLAGGYVYLTWYSLEKWNAQGSVQLITGYIAMAGAVVVAFGKTTEKLIASAVGTKVEPEEEQANEK